MSPSPECSQVFSLCWWCSSVGFIILCHPAHIGLFAAQCKAVWKCMSTSNLKAIVLWWNMIGWCTKGIAQDIFWVSRSTYVRWCRGLELSAAESHTVGILSHKAFAIKTLCNDLQILSENTPFKLAYSVWFWPYWLHSDYSWFCTWLLC